MASFVYTPAKALLAKGLLNLHTGGNDIRMALCMSNTTADTDQDAATISAIGTLDEMDGANYARKTLAGEVVNQDDANNRAEFDFDDVTWTALGAGTRAIAGALIFKFVTNDTDNIPIAWVDSGGFPVTANGGDLTYAVDAQGAIQLT